MPTVTVVIPAFNAERYIGEALGSIREQTLRGVEVVLVDDGSIDGTLREAERFAGSLDLTIVRQANAGPAAARNAGIRRARGRHCAFLDADDVMLPERLAAQTALLEVEPDLGLVHTDLMTFDERGIIHRTRRAFSEPCGGMVLDRLLLDNFITTSTVMAPTERLLQAGLFGEGRRVSEDFDLWLRMAARWKVGFIDRPLVWYRRRSGSLSDDKLATGRSALEVIEAFWREHPVYGRSDPAVRHASLARHLFTVGAAALGQARRGIAVTYLVRSLGHDPGNPTSWKWLAKTLLVPSRRLAHKGPSGTAETAVLASGPQRPWWARSTGQEERCRGERVSNGLRILHIGNGRAVKIRAIVDACLARGHEVHMIAIPPIAEGWKGVAWHCLPNPPVFGQAKVLARLVQVRRLARQLRPDVVHAHNAWGPGWYGAFTGVHPLVIHAYGGDLLPDQYGGRPVLQRWLTSWTCRTAERVIVTGRHMIDASAGLGIPRDRLMVLPRGVDLKHYRPGLDTTEVRRRLDLEVGARVILSPRYQVDETLYNLDTVIDALVAVRQRFPDAVCLQLYDPEREQGRAKLEKLAAERRLGQSYRLVPMVNNGTMPLFYNLADAVLSVPSSDGFPVTVLEASACGTPLIVSSLPYCTEWFVDGENGLLVPVRDPNALAEALVALCADGDLRRRLGAAGRRLVEERADYSRCMDALEDLYWDLLAKFRPIRAEEP